MRSGGSSGTATKGGIRYSAQVLLIAALYFAAAKLGLALAIPPGYETSVWPPSGIALAALVNFTKFGFAPVFVSCSAILIGGSWYGHINERRVAARAKA